MNPPPRDRTTAAINGFAVFTSLPGALIAVLLGLHAAIPLAGAGEAPVVPLWPDEKLTPIPESETFTERSKDPAKPNRSFRHVSKPTITVYLPPDAKSPAAAFIICPGGGYGGLAIDKEGHDVARWLNTLGVAGVVLKYRLPRAELSVGQTPLPVQDAWRAIRLVRSRAGEWNIDPKRTGIMGFSAGGHLASTVATHFDGGKADAVDPIERQSSRPDFQVLLYPVISFQPVFGHGGSRNALLGKIADEKLIDLYSNEKQVTAQTPPAFMVHAKDDGTVKLENSERYRDAMQRTGVPCELHVFDKGGHGFGLGVNGGEVATWPKHCAAWLRAAKLAGPAE